MSRETRREMLPNVTGAVKAFREGPGNGFVRWQVLWCKNGIATSVARASEWVRNDAFGVEWVEQRMSEVNAARAARGL